MELTCVLITEHLEEFGSHQVVAKRVGNAALKFVTTNPPVIAACAFVLYGEQRLHHTICLTYRGSFAQTKSAHLAKNTRYIGWGFLNILESQNLNESSLYRLGPQGWLQAKRHFRGLYKTSLR